MKYGQVLRNGLIVMCESLLKMTTEDDGIVLAKMDRIEPDRRRSQVSVRKPIGGALRMFMVATAGALIVLGMQLVPTFFTASPPSVLQPTSFPEGPDVLGQMSRLQHFIYGPYVILPWFLVMVYLAISRRNQPKSWLYALLAGAALPSVIFHFILRWI
jgi:hypothetical protein